MEQDGHVNGHSLRAKDVSFPQPRHRSKPQLRPRQFTRRNSSGLRSSSLPPNATQAPTDTEILSNGAVPRLQGEGADRKTGNAFFDRPHAVNFVDTPDYRNGDSEASFVAALDSRLNSFDRENRPPRPPVLSPSLIGVKLPRTVIRSLQNLIEFRKVVGDYREEVKDRRDDASRQRLRARQIQEQLNEAFASQRTAVPARAGSGSSVVTRGSSQPGDLMREAALAWTISEKLDEELEKAESRLSGYDVRLEEKEVKLYRRLQRVTLHSVSASEDESSQDDGDDVSSALPGDVQSDDAHTLVNEYLDVVAVINMTRERLNEFEITHRTLVQQTEKAVDEGMPAVRMSRGALEDYYETRSTMINDLLAAKKKATDLRQQCLDQNLFADENADIDALDEALKYNVGQGEVSRMYDYHYEDSHRGIRPLELLLVPQSFSEDRVAAWRMQTFVASYGMQNDAIEEETWSKPKGKSFEWRVEHEADVHGDSEPSRPHPISDGEEFAQHYSYKFSTMRRKGNTWFGGPIDSSQSEPDINYREGKKPPACSEDRDIKSHTKRPRSWIETVRERNMRLISWMVFMNR